MIVLTYDFPHWKTQQMLFRLWLEDHPVNAVIAAPRKELSLPSATRIGVRPAACFRFAALEKPFGLRGLRRLMRTVMGRTPDRRY